jgi:hypothetical protein
MSTEGMIVAEVLMSSSGRVLGGRAVERSGGAV